MYPSSKWKCLTQSALVGLRACGLFAPTPSLSIYGLVPTVGTLSSLLESIKLIFEHTSTEAHDEPRPSEVTNARREDKQNSFTVPDLFSVPCLWDSRTYLNCAPDCVWQIKGIRGVGVHSERDDSNRLILICGCEASVIPRGAGHVVICLVLKCVRQSVVHDSPDSAGLVANEIHLAIVGNTRAYGNRGITAAAGSYRDINFFWCSEFGFSWFRHFHLSFYV